MQTSLQPSRDSSSGRRARQTSQRNTWAKLEYCSSTWMRRCSRSRLIARRNICVSSVSICGFPRPGLVAQPDGFGEAMSGFPGLQAVAADHAPAAGIRAHRQSHAAHESLVRGHVIPWVFGIRLALNSRQRRSIAVGGGSLDCRRRLNRYSKCRASPRLLA